MNLPYHPPEDSIPPELSRMLLERLRITEELLETIEHVYRSMSNEQRTLFWRYTQEDDRSGALGLIMEQFSKQLDQILEEKPKSARILETKVGKLEDVLTVQQAKICAVFLTNPPSREMLLKTLETHRKRQLKYAEKKGLEERFKGRLSPTEDDMTKRYSTLEMTERTVRAALSVVLLEDILEESGWGEKNAPEDDCYWYVRADDENRDDYKDEDTEENRAWNKMLETEGMMPFLGFGSGDGDCTIYTKSFFELGITLENLIGQNAKEYVEYMLRQEDPEFFKEWEQREKEKN